jgi:maleylpyruvate isomerase
VTSNVASAEAAELAAGYAARVDGATQRLVQTAAGISDEQARGPSLLPDWSRGHVLTHLARNADSLRNLLTWARTGVETPQYPSVEARDAAIDEGAGRPVAAIIDDIGTSAAALAAEAAILTDQNWAAEVRGMNANSHPAWYTLWRRLVEVEIHHVDLDAGYGPQDWPEPFASECLVLASGRFAGPDSPAARLVSSDGGASFRIGPPSQEPAVEIIGPTRDLLAWLTGRSTGPGLTAEPAGPLPPLPPW